LREQPGRFIRAGHFHAFLEDWAVALTGRKLRFAEEYLVDLNGAKAAVRAGYAESRDRSTASRLLTEPEVAAFVEAGIAARSKRTQIDADWVLKRLEAEAEADMADLYDEHGGLKPIREWPEIWRKGLVAGVEVEELRTDGAVLGLVRKIRLSDRIKRVELIGKHVGVQAFRDQVGLGGPGGGPIETDNTLRIEFVRPKKG
jgi:phage terminase small subunit